MLNLDRRASQILEATFALILMFLILSNGFAFSSIIRAGGGVYIDAVKALQGR